MTAGFHIFDTQVKMKPLRRLTAKGAKWLWTPDDQRTFESLKSDLARTTTLYAPDFNRPFHLYSDASDIGCGCVLGQQRKVVIDGEESEEMVPIAFASWVFDSTQMNYSAGEGELLGIILALRKFQYYLMGQHIDVYTDHKPLLGMMKLQNSALAL